MSRRQEEEARSAAEPAPEPAADVPALSCQPPSPDTSPDSELFFDSCDDRRRRRTFRPDSHKLGSARSFENLPQTASSPNLPVQEINGSRCANPPLHRSNSSHTPSHLAMTASADRAPPAADGSQDTLSELSRQQEAGSEPSLAAARPESTRSSDSGRKESKRARRTPWYSLLKNSYKQRCDEFRRLFDIPSDERLIVDYSCAQVDVGKMIYHGRLYVSQNYICFTSNIFKWNVSFCQPLRDVRAVTKMNVLVFPSGINIETATDKYVLSSFASRDRAFVNIENIWRNCIEKQVLSASQLWQMVHDLYGSELGLTSDDDDYVDPSAEDDSCHKRSDSRQPAAEFYHAAGRLEVDSAAGSDAPAAAPPSPAGQLRSTRDEDESDTTEDEPAAACCDGSQHVGRHVTSLELPLHVDQVFTLLFTHSDFSDAFYRERKYYDVQAGEWLDGEGGTKVRKIRFQIDVNHPLGKTTTVTEEQTMQPISQAGCLYAVDSEANNTGVPMADVFYIVKHHCLSKLSSRKTRLNIWCQTKFRKSTLFKGFIEKTANDGMVEHHSVLNQMLLETTGEVSKHKRAKRRRAGSKGGGADLLSDGPATLSPRGVKGVGPSGELRPAASDGLLLSVLAFMLLLVLMNGYLYHRMSRLGEQTEAFAHRELLLTQMKSRPRSLDECLRLVQHQERLHRTELLKWQQIVHSVTTLLKQSETALGSLQTALEAQRAREWPPPAEPGPDSAAAACGAGAGCPAGS